MIRLTLILLIMFSLLTGSCGSRKNKLDRRNMIPEKELTSILTDIYITDGLLTLPKINHLYKPLDSLSSYREVVEKHGFTIESMDKTIKFYFIKRPKELIKIYDQVLGVLSEMDSRFEKEAIVLQGRVSNLWKGRESYAFPYLSGADSTNFDLTASVTGTYILTFTATLYPEDQTLNPRLTAYTCNPDSIETGKRHYVTILPYIKDGQPHTYSLIIRAQDKSQLHLRGLFYDFDNNPDESGKKLLIEKISYTYTSA